MTCMEAQALITPFIIDQLDIVTLEQFIDHVEKCADCKEELEVYYALLTAMKQLDEDEEVSADFAKELENKINDSQEKILRAKIVHIRKRVLFFILVIFIGLFTSVSVSVVEEVLTLSKEAKFNSFVIQQKVFEPYMKEFTFDEMISYQQLQEEVERVKAKEKEEIEKEKEEERQREKAKQKREKEAAILRAEKAMEEGYQKLGKFSRSYEEASDLKKLRYDELQAVEEGKGIPVDTPMEYSR